ncbi:MAG: PqqD family protein [Caldilineaceae bacterium]|nr:PqqD family protein [Caldilineaceae bacterium]
MHRPADHLQIDHTRVIHETVDQETLIIDSQTGAYFILRDSGAEIWQLLSQDGNLATLLARLAHAYTMPIATLQPLVQPFLDELVGAGLVTITTESAPSPPWPADPGTAQAGQTVADFVAPTLQQFNDMHHLLLIDPIHEVAETGWPFPPTNAAPNASEARNHATG